jgi:hypothetical protein
MVISLIVEETKTIKLKDYVTTKLHDDKTTLSILLYLSFRSRRIELRMTRRELA